MRAAAAAASKRGIALGVSCLTSLFVLAVSTAHVVSIMYFLYSLYGMVTEGSSGAAVVAGEEEATEHDAVEVQQTVADRRDETLAVAGQQTTSLNVHKEVGGDL